MSRELISRSPDLKRLREDGYEIDIVGGHLLLKHVPYVTAQREVKFGILVSTLTLAGDRTARPETHVVFFVGEHPCKKDGTEIQGIKHQEQHKVLADGLEVDRSFSNKPQAGYPDYYEKMTTYATIISGPAESLDPKVTARTFVTETTDDEPVFRYMDTATTRAGIGAVSTHLEGHKVAIIGLGGTGSYVLDLVAKTPVAEIHLFDDDRFLQHNAFRSPGAPPIEQLRSMRRKVEYLSEIYSRMHRGVVPHPVRLERSNEGLLDELDFAFVCVDSGSARRELIEILGKHNMPFIDVGMGLEVLDDKQVLIGQLRVSTSTPSFRDSEKHMPVSDSDQNQDYNRNIQIADLNCLNAAMAVIRWKKLCGFYQDLEGEHHSVYAVNVNQLVSEEQRCDGKDAEG